MLPTALAIAAATTLVAERAARRFEGRKRAIALGVGSLFLAGSLWYLSAVERRMVDVA